MTILCAVATALYLLQTTPQAPFYANQGPLEIKNVVITPERPQIHQPIEITFDLSGNWSNAFDPRQISVSALVTGGQDTFATIYGFIDVTFEKMEDKLVPIGQPKWKVRFAPWNIGTYRIKLSATDRMQRIDYPDINLRVDGPSRGEVGFQGFISVTEDARYFTIDQRLFFPIISEPVTPSESDLSKIFAAIDSAKKSGCNTIRLFLSPQGLGLEWKGGEFGGLGVLKLSNAWNIDQALKAAKLTGLKVIFCLGTSYELEEGWPNNPYNAANGGPCITPNDFWTNLQARLFYKRMLRYLISRMQSDSTCIGIQFWKNVKAPDYWLQEMANEVYSIHPYAIMITTESDEPHILKMKRINTMLIPFVLPENSPYKSVYHFISKIKPSASKPLFMSLEHPQEKPLVDDISWLQLVAGCAGTSPNKSIKINETIPDIASELELHKRKLQPQFKENEEIEYYASIDSLGGILFVVNKTQEKPLNLSNHIEVTTFRGGIYRYKWIDASNANVLSEGEARENKGTINLSLPETNNAAICILIRK